MQLTRRTKTFRLSTALIVPTALAFAQTAIKPERTAPLYRVTVVQRTVKAINYRYRSGPTNIDFHGTVLLPHAKGGATVESKQGRTQIDAHFENLTAPQQFGREYLAYVLWAITPEGRPRNVGEVIPGHSDHANVRVTTDLQAFALIVTAEPYSAVRQPSNVVVLENQVRADTSGTIETVEAKYDLLPRGEYTLHESSTGGATEASAPKVSMHEYEALSELYQAKNAVAIAAANGAQRYAPDTFSRAQLALRNAQALHAGKSDYRRVVQDAREAAQTAEDARLIARRRQENEKVKTATADLSQTKTELATARQARQKALADAQKARSEAQAARQEAVAAREARDSTEAQASIARERAEQARSKAQARSFELAQDQQELDRARERALRMELLESLKERIPTLDTTRGLVATVPDNGFRGASLGAKATEQVAGVAAILSSHPDLHVSVQGYSDATSKEALTRERADVVKRVLIESGLPSARISSQGLGASRPMASNSTPEGRRQNSRVEIVITGNSIGTLAYWEQPDTVTSSVEPVFGGSGQ
jgi:outer membrane protein OmpA-like peptidoglycan-associated protein